MPTYCYECESHGEFEIQHSIKEEVKFCPKCEEEGKTEQPLKRLISLSSFILNGTGWFKTGGY